MKHALVTGAGGFIGGHLVRYLKERGYWVRGVDIKHPEFREHGCDEFLKYDLRDDTYARLSVIPPNGSEQIDEVYHLAADMGGMGFIHAEELDVVRNNTRINLNMIEAATRFFVRRFFFASSVCVYRDMQPDEPPLIEENAYPAWPHNEYGWEKLYAERMMQTYARHMNIEVRIARFQNCYGPYGTWRGGREKAPAALCRKVAEAADGGTVDVWGDGTAVRNFIYVDDLVDAVYTLTQSGCVWPTNIGTEEYVTINDLVSIINEIADKHIIIQHVDGPVGVQARNFTHARIRSLGWEPQHSLRDGIEKTYRWIEEQVKALQHA